MPNDKVTLAVLGQKMDSMHEDLRSIHQDVKLNTEFRLKFIGILTAVSGGSAIIGAVVAKFIDKIIHGIFG